MSLKLYVLVRSDLSPGQKAVQAGHAVAEFCKQEAHPWRWMNGTLIYLSVANLNELLCWYKKCVEPVAFYEPDKGMEMTAFSTLTPVEGFETLKLLR